jgi:hypothetical protein
MIFVKEQVPACPQRKTTDIPFFGFDLSSISISGGYIEMPCPLAMGNIVSGSYSLFFPGQIELVSFNPHLW